MLKALPALAAFVSVIVFGGSVYPKERSGNSFIMNVISVDMAQRLDSVGRVNLLNIEQGWSMAAALDEIGRPNLRIQARDQSGVSRTILVYISRGGSPNYVTFGADNIVDAVTTYEAISLNRARALTKRFRNSINVDIENYEYIDRNPLTMKDVLEAWGMPDEVGGVGIATWIYRMPDGSGYVVTLSDRAPFYAVAEKIELR